MSRGRCATPKPVFPRDREKEKDVAGKRHGESREQIPFTPLDLPQTSLPLIAPLNTAREIIVWTELIMQMIHFPRALRGGLCEVTP